MTFLDEHAPWGSPVDAGIPLPPFADAEEHVRFTRALQLHVTLLDDGGPALSTIALAVALEPPRRGERAAEWLTPLELTVSLTTWFPAPWTPAALASTLARTERDAPLRHGDGWSWLGDPDFSAVPGRGGGWTIERFERGTGETASVADDRDLVVLWLSHFRDGFGFPLGHGHDEAATARLAEASRAVISTDEKDAAYPYRVQWREEREAALRRGWHATG